MLFQVHGNRTVIRTVHCVSPLTANATTVALYAVCRRGNEYLSADQIIRLMNGMTVISRCVMMAAHTVVWLTPSHPFCRRALDCRGNQHAEDAFHILRGGKHDFRFDRAFAYP